MAKPDYSVREKLERIEQLKSTMDARHLRVCAHILSGKNHGDAWRAVYDQVRRRRTAESNCNRMLRNAASGGREYIDLMTWRYQLEAATKLGIDSEYVLANLKSVVERCMQPQPVIDKAGNPKLERSKASGELMPVYTFNASGAIRALELIGKEIGMFKEKPPANQENPLAELLRQIGERNTHRSLLPSGL